jgi:hypothetical protein
MLHLPADRLAELVDTEATEQELAHLRSCAACARERAAFRALRELAAAERDVASEPLVPWATLRRELRAEGLVTTTAEQPAVRSASGSSVAARRPRTQYWSMRIAASLVLLASGALYGRATAPAAETATQAGSAAVAGVPASQEEPVFGNTEEALTALMRAQEHYQRAAAFLLASDTTLGTNTPMLYKQRLAALDELMGVTRLALTRVPHDPVINSYYLAALGAREATLQQLELTLPEGTRIDRF